MDLCRCCLSNFCFKDMCNEYEFNGVQETYRDMLFDTFNLKLNKYLTCRQLICEVCVVKLREASAFKLQVIQAEEAITNNHLLVTEEQKSDINASHESVTDCDDNYLDDTISSDADFWNTNTVVNKNKDDGLCMKRVESTVLNDNSLMKTYVTLKSVKKMRSVMPRETNIHAKTKLLKKSKSSAPKNNLELEKDRENTLSLILNSNMCLFISLKTKYRCYFCTQAFFCIQELREHSKTHSNTKDVERKIKRLTGLSFKNVDISNLECKQCSESCENLNELGTHLKNKHDIPFRNSNHFLIPYKLESGFKCLVCCENFKSYLKLSIHMNTHFTNHVCEICGVSFINRLSLRMHIQSVHTVKSCSICKATFRNVSLKAQHMRKSHNLKNKYKRYCLECDKTFKYAYSLDQHRIQEHGAKKQTINCTECGKSFLSSNNLKIHTRSVHLHERNYACSVCTMGFFTSTDKKRHEKTHQDVRSFSCDYCEGKFKAKDSLRRHLRRQHGQVSGK